MSRGGYTGGSTSSYTGSSSTSSFTSGSSWYGSFSSSSSSSSSASDYLSSSSSSSDSSCDHKCQLGWGIGFGIVVFICGGWMIVVYGPLLALGLVIMFCGWAWRICQRLWMRLMKGTARIKRCLLSPVWYWYGVRNQDGKKKKKAVKVDGKVTELELFDCGNLLAEENENGKEGSIGSDRALVEGVPLWTRLCRFAARPLHFLMKIRPRQMREADIEKNEIDPVSTQSHLMAHLRALKPHRPQIRSPMWPPLKTPHESIRVGQDFIPSVLSPTSAKKETMLSLDSWKKVDEKEGSIGPDRTLTDRPSPWRRIRSFVSSFRSPHPLYSHDECAERSSDRDLENHKKKGVSSLSSSSNVLGSEDEKASESKPVESPKPVFRRPL